MKGKELSLTAVLAHAYAHAPAVRESFDRAGLKPADIRTPADLARLPVTRKEALREVQNRDLPFGGLLAVAPANLARIFMSPGPIYDPQGRVTDYWRWAEALETAGFRPGDIVLNTFSYHLTPAGFMFDEGLRALGCTVVPAGVGNTDLQVQVMREVRITGYTGVPSFLMTLIRKAEEQGHDFRRDFALRRAFFTAEKLPDSLRRTLEDTYGIETFQGYGTADLGCVAYECRAREGMHVVNSVVVEVVEPGTGVPVAPGEMGELAVTLLNDTYPLVRFGTGDLSYLASGPCPCGRDTPRIMGVLGRADDAVKVRGLFVHSSQIASVMDRFSAVRAFQGVVTRTEHVDRLSIRVELAGTNPEEVAGDLGEALRAVLRLRFDLEFLPEGSITENAGKIVDARVWD